MNREEFITIREEMMEEVDNIIDYCDELSEDMKDTLIVKINDMISNKMDPAGLG